MLGSSKDALFPLPGSLDSGTELLHSSITLEIGAGRGGSQSRWKLRPRLRLRGHVIISSSVDNGRLTPLPIVLGPTGSGKSELAIHVALAVVGEIVNCDSLQLYRGFDVGTAKVPTADRSGVRHHLIDLVDPDQLFTAGDYARLAPGVLREIADRGKIPVIAGGTGFYLRALLDGLSPGPPRDESIRTRLERREAKRTGSMHRILRRLDPATAARIHANDKNKTLRALEMRLVAGKSASSLFARGRAGLTGFRPIKLGLDPPRELLYRTLDERTVRIFEQGLIAEVRHLLATGVPAEAKPFESLGYKQALAVIQGRLTSAEALLSTQMETRRYAKRQLTWFRKEPGVHWLRGFGGEAEIQAEALAIIGEDQDANTSIARL